MARLSKCVRHELNGMSQQLGQVIDLLQDEKVVGFARRQDNSPNGSDYKIVNPACCETSYSPPCVSVYGIHGSKLVFLWTIKKQLDSLLIDSNKVEQLTN